MSHRSTIVIVVCSILFLVFDVSAAPAYDSSALFSRLMKGDTLDNFGHFMAPAGDVNRDGFDDFWVSRTFDGIWSDFYLHCGGTQLDTVPHVTWHLPAFRLYNVGDMNNDQYDDFLIVYLDTLTTAPLYFGLHYGGPLLSPQPAKRFSVHPYLGTSVQIGMDHMVTGGTDMDGDLKPDLLIGEPVGDGGNGAYLYSSSPTLDTIADYHFQYGAFPDIQQSGMAVAFLPNFDGHSYIALGVNGYSAYPPKPGHVVLFRGGKELDTIPDLVFHNPVDPSDFSFGQDLCVLGGANGDGYTDFVEHASGAPGYLYFGNSLSDTVVDLTILPNFQALENVGDVNHDSFPDMLIHEDAFQGRAWLYYGGLEMDGIVDSIVIPPIDALHFGRGASPLGDINGDGVSDFGVAAMQSTYGWWPGQVEVYLGWNEHPVDVSDDSTSLPHRFTLHQNYPNPFNPLTEISFDLPKRTTAKLSVFNIKGERVVTLLDCELSAGSRHVSWNGCDAAGSPVASGVYLYHLETNDAVQTKKMLLLK